MSSASVNAKRYGQLGEGIVRCLHRIAYRLIAPVGLLALSVACTTTIRAPERVREPVKVVLLDHGHHSSLVLPSADGQMIRYAYGDWMWYARRQTGPLQALATLLLPTQGTLGRRALGAPPTLADIDRRVAVPIEQRWEITVERSRVRALRQNLEQIYQQHAKTALMNRAYDLRFVPHPDAYSYFHNSNHMTADWLRRLGCKIEGPAFASCWSVTR
ncbi:MAG: DUF2459 domain-containing protein [Nitrococcus mobilis]|nr:DUF2459 domain-containing protein [Nitrococcus mobilis]